MAKKAYKKVVRGSDREIAARAKILEYFKDSPIPDDEIINSLALYSRSTALAKTLYLNELYERMINLPGIIIEFGVWWGANLALFEHFRSVYEPYNWTRKVVGFDTFKGYPAVGPKDGNSIHAAVGGYAVAEGYEERLKKILDAHEQDNVMAHIKKYEIIKGDVNKTIDKYLSDNPHTIIALAYFDLALYGPTKKCLEAIRPYLVKGSVIAMDELCSEDFPGETIAFREVFSSMKFSVVRSRFLPDRAIVTIE